MRILITNAFLENRTGSEVYAEELAHGLRGRGHEVALYAPRLGKLARELRRHGIPVCNDPAECPWRPDVIHAQHYVPTARAALAFPPIPIVGVCHGALPMEETPCAAPNVRVWAGVDLACQRRIAAETGVNADSILIIPNAVRLDLFRAREKFSPQIKTALVFGNTARENSRLAALRAACERHEIALTAAGLGVGAVSDRPHELLPQFDLVFAKGRCALEALACGCSVILSDERGLGPAVMAAQYAALRPWNFGYMLLNAPHTVELIGQRLRRCTAENAAAVMELCRADADQERCLDAWEAAYADAIRQGGSTAAGMLRFAQSLAQWPAPAPGPAAGRTGCQPGNDEQYGVERRRSQVFLKAYEKALGGLRKRDKAGGILAKVLPEASRVIADEVRLINPAERTKLEALHGAPLPVPPEPEPLLFVVGHARSGTTWLRLTLDAHPQLAMPPETGFLGNFVGMSRWGSSLRDEFIRQVVKYPADAPHFSDYGMTEEEFRKALEAINPFTITEGLRAFYRLYAAKHNKPRSGDKTPLYLMMMPDIARLLPEARFVHLVRDGRDCIASLRRQVFAPSDDVATLAAHWATHVQHGRADGAAMPHYLEVRYEDLVSDREAELRRICEFAGLAWSDALLRHEENAGARLRETQDVVSTDGRVLVSKEQRHTLHAPATESLLTNRIGMWRQQSSATDVATIEALAGQVLEDFGYALSS